MEIIKVSQGTTTYTALVIGNNLIIEQEQQEHFNGKRVYNIAYDNTGQFTFVIQKTQIKAIDAGKGIRAFLEREKGNALSFSFLNKVWENVKSL